MNFEFDLMGKCSLSARKTAVGIRTKPFPCRYDVIIMTSMGKCSLYARKTSVSIRT